MELAPAAQRELRRLPALARSRLAEPILGVVVEGGDVAHAVDGSPEALDRGEPGKVRGHSGTWRIRVGPYRVVYDIHDDMALIVVLKVVRRAESTYSSL